MTDLYQLDLATLAGVIARREASPVEAVGAALERIERLNGDLHAFVAVQPEAALAAARRAEEAISAGDDVGPLTGVPVAAKDLFRVAGMELTCGSKLVREDGFHDDATSVARLKAAGAIVVGVLNLHEFAFGPTGINANTGTARNPWNRERSCGGSSSGSGCAVAASMVPAALGTDTGGSIRIPAAVCGVVGLKQTFGLASRAGIYPLSETFDHGGPLTRTVRDCAMVLAAIAGADERDETTRGARVDDYTSQLGTGVEGLRVGVPAEFFFDDLDADVDAAVRAAIDAFADMGAQVEEVAMPFAAEANRAWDTITLSEAWSVHQAHVEAQAAEMLPDVAARLLHGKDIGVDDVAEARRTRARIQGEMAALMRRFDVLCAPTSPIPAVDAETGNVRVGDAEVDGARVLGRLTRLAAFTGQPAISLPCGFTAQGLPIGLQLFGDWFGEAALLGAAHAYEQASPWSARRPSGLD